MNIETFIFKNVTYKPKKQEIQKLIKNKFNEVCKNNKGLSDSDLHNAKIELAEIYKYFTPAKPKKAKDSIAWVDLACSTDETRKNITSMYVKNETLYGTDGHRVHSVDLDLSVFSGIKDGYYTYDGEKLNPLETDQTYPEIERVIPAKEYSETLHKDNLKIVSRGKDYYYYITLFGHLYGFNKKYIDQAMQDVNSCEIYVERLADKGLMYPPAVLFELQCKGSYKQAVIMPLQQSYIAELIANDS